MYGSSLDFSGISLPGVGGGINAGNAMTTDQLARLNKTGKKWSPNAEGGMSHHNETQLKANEQNRQKRESLVNRLYDDHADGSTAMKEIFDRKKARSKQFMSLKEKEYPFAEAAPGDSQDNELMAMPQPFAMAEGCKCGTCAACRDKKRKETEYREWSTEKREKMKKGEISGKFAGPNQSFPISSEEDVEAAWASVGRAKNPRQVMRNIIRIARELKLENGLPESVKARIAKGESGLPS
jgi:hypothetical protein